MMLKVLYPTEQQQRSVNERIAGGCVCVCVYKNLVMSQEGKTHIQKVKDMLIAKALCIIIIIIIV